MHLLSGAQLGITYKPMPKNSKCKWREFSFILWLILFIYVLPLRMITIKD